MLWMVLDIDYMNAFKLVPVVFSFLMLGAHFMRGQFYPLVFVSLAFPVLLLVKRWWAARLVQIVLLLGALEWIRTLLVLVGQRREAGQPWTRMAIILAVVSLFTVCSAMVFCGKSLKKKYGLGDAQQR
jgi:hypothetical protein